MSSGSALSCGPVAAIGARARAAALDDRGVLPVTPFAPWCFVPGNKSGAGGDHAGWVLSLRARRSDSVLPAPPPGQPPASSRWKGGGNGRAEEENEERRCRGPACGRGRPGRRGGGRGAGRGGDVRGRGRCRQ